MPSLLTILGILLSTQLSDSAGDRYASPDETSISAEQGATPPAGTGEAASEEAPVSEHSTDGQQPYAPAEEPESDTPAESPANLRRPLHNTPRESTTQPATVDQQQPTAPASDTGEDATGEKARQLWENLADADFDASLSGNEMSLADALGRAASRSVQTQVAEAYWEVSTAMAERRLSRRENTELETLKQSVPQPATAWGAASQAVAARIEMADLRVSAAQSQLANFLDLSAGNMQIVATDDPLCGAYKTRYDEIFADRPSEPGRYLHELILAQHQELERLTEEVEAARQWLFAVSEQLGQQSDGAQLLKAFELFSARRHMFLRAVCDYNRAIARYSEIASPGEVGTSRLVAMLIPGGDSDGNAWGDSGVRRASAEEPVATRPGDNEPPSTFDQGAWNPAPNSTGTSGTPERSILVVPR